MTYITHFSSNLCLISAKNISKLQKKQSASKFLHNRLNFIIVSIRNHNYKVIRGITKKFTHA